MIYQQVCLFRLFPINKEPEVRSVLPGGASVIEIHSEFVASYLKSQFERGHPLPQGHGIYALPFQDIGIGLKAEKGSHKGANQDKDNA